MVSGGLSAGTSAMTRMFSGVVAKVAAKLEETGAVPWWV